MNPFDPLRARLAERVPARDGGEVVTQSAVALILTPGERGLEALFIRRSQRPDDPWSGHVALPGGRREPSDLDLLATARRETEEEVGVKLRADGLLGSLDDLRPTVTPKGTLLVRPYAFGVPQRPMTALSDEVSAVEWLALSQLAGSMDRAVIDVGAARREVDCYRIGDIVIWGLTYRILRDFLPLIG